MPEGNVPYRDVALSGELLAISHFPLPEDRANAEAARELGLESFLYRQSALQRFAAAGLAASVENERTSRTQPTPVSALLEGAAIDALPVVETDMTWCVLHAS